MYEPDRYEYNGKRYKKKIVFKLVVCKEREASPTNENTNINPSTQYIVDYIQEV